ncbi:MAG: hypothetical protein IT210_25300 [Armatimonadetes bacterium]|nr:hypothetical protein [Armatimonadota bacterium]
MTHHFSDYKLMNIRLTPDELEVLSQLIAGYSIEEAALNLGMSRETIEHCVAMVYGKLQKTGVATAPGSLFPELAWMEDDEIGSTQ